MSVMGLDIGTSGCKAVAISREGLILGISHREYSFQSPRPGRLEIDPEVLWIAVCEAIKETTELCRKDPVESVCIATMGDSFVPLDGNGKPAGPFILASDNRSVDETAVLVDRLGKEKLFGLTGMPPHPINTITKIMWIKNNDRDMFEQSRMYLCCEDFIIERLTGKPATSYSSASRTMAFDVNTKEWSDEILSAADLNSDIFPEAVSSGSVVGTVTDDSAKNLFGNSGVKVVTGGMDQTCATLGADAYSEGRILNSMGTLEVLAPTIERKSIKGKLAEGLLERDFSVNEHVIPGKVLIMGLVINAGSIIRWFRNEFVSGSEKDFLKMFNGCNERLTPLIFFPYFSGRGTPCMDPDAVGMWWGIDFSTGKKELFQAVLQGITYESYKNLDSLKNLGIPVSSITCVGGSARSLDWLQMKSDLFGVPVRQNLNNDAAGIGAGILAGTAVGYWESLESAVALFSGKEKTLEPDKNKTILLKKHYELFDELHKTVLSKYKKFKEVLPYIG